MAAWALATMASVCRSLASAVSKSLCELVVLVAQILLAVEVVDGEVALGLGGFELRLFLVGDEADEDVALPTVSPLSKRISLTMPGRSALTVTPWTASSEPMARRVGCHRAGWITVVVTAAGGGSNAPLFASATTLLICNAFTPPTITNRMNTALSR